MTVSLFCSIFLLYFCCCQAPFSAHGLQSTLNTGLVSSSTEHRHRRVEDGRRSYRLSVAAKAEDGVIYDDDLIMKASEKLDWEKSEEKSQKPILNLSLRDASPEETIVNTNDAADDSLEWNQGQRWTTTVDHLSNLGVFANDEDSIKSSRILLENCPQLFRLDPSSIQETAKWIIDEFGLAYLQAAVLLEGNSILISFRKDDASYGLEFMSVMMMMDAKMACAASSAFLLEAIRGGIQERAVSAALDIASSATSKASRSIASDTMESFRQLRDANRHKK